MFGSRSGDLPRSRWLPVALAGMLLAGGCVAGGESERRVHYDCERGMALTVIFSGSTARVFSGDGPPVVLERQRVASGFLYQSNVRSIRGKGRNMTYTVGRMAPIQCRQVGSGRR